VLVVPSDPPGPADRAVLFLAAVTALGLVVLDVRGAQPTTALSVVRTDHDGTHTRRG
jgi:hypothetical protein